MKKTSLAVQSARLVWSLSIYNLNMYHEKLKQRLCRKAEPLFFYDCNLFYTGLDLCHGFLLCENFRSFITHAVKDKPQFPWHKIIKTSLLPSLTNTLYFPAEVVYSPLKPTFYLFDRKKQGFDMYPTVLSFDVLCANVLFVIPFAVVPTDRCLRVGEHLFKALCQQSFVYR